MHGSFRAIGSVTLALAFLLPAAAPAAAAGPARPTYGYRPEFVTEREVGRWEDCVWAAASMLVDKWTSGRLTITKDRLRRLSGDRHGGSKLGLVGRVLRKIGLPARTSPSGGAVIKWATFRTRLAAGGGAILLGDASKLPRWYGRWDLSFWGGTGNKDDHALYVDRYDRANDRFWIMDPLAPAGWPGEWIGGRDLRAFAWSTPNGALSALMTPAAKPLPFDGVRLGVPIATVRPNVLSVRWPVEKTPKHWRRPPLDVTLAVRPASDTLVPPGPAVVSAPPLAPPGATGGDAPVVAKSVGLGGGMLSATVPLPRIAGTYRIDAGVRLARLHRTVATAALTVYVPGERRATISTTSSPETVAMGPYALVTDVTNSGTVSWADPTWSAAMQAAASPVRNTRLVATWVLLAASTEASSRLTTGQVPDAVTLSVLPLAPGTSARISASIATPTIPGQWALMLDIVDDADGSFAAHGSRPGAILVDLVETIAGLTPVADLDPGP
jgi:hypothetical protein